MSGEWVMLDQHYVDIWIYAVSGDFQDLKLLETCAGREHLGMCLSAAWRLHGLWPRRTFAAPNRVVFGIRLLLWVWHVRHRLTWIGSHWNWILILLFGVGLERGCPCGAQGPRVNLGNIL